MVALCAPEGEPGSVFTSRADPPSMPEPGLWGNPQATHPSCCTSRAPDMSAGSFCAPSMVHSRLYGTPMSFDRSCAVAIRWKTFQSQLSVVMQRPCVDAVLHAAAQRIVRALGVGRRHAKSLRPHHSMRRPYTRALGHPTWQARNVFCSFWYCSLQLLCIVHNSCCLQQCPSNVEQLSS